MTHTFDNQVFEQYRGKQNTVWEMTEEELSSVIAKATRGSIRKINDMKIADIKAALTYLDLGVVKPAKGDARKKDNWVKEAFWALFKLDPDINKAIDRLSLALGIYRTEVLEDDERAALAAEANKTEPTNTSVSKETITETIKEVDTAIATVRTISKKVTEAEQKLQRQTELNRLPAEVKWESDFMGKVTIGKEVREFWVQDPYENPIVNLVTSNGMVVLSCWQTTKDNPFMRAAVREFHELIASRDEFSLIENRLLAIAMQLSGSKKRANWYAQSAEELVLKDGQRMIWKSGAEYLHTLEQIDAIDLSQGTIYKNAQYFARLFPNVYQYVEGFALLNGKLFHHAWVYSKVNCKAIDVTFNEPDIQLFGIIFDIDWVDKVVAFRPKEEDISPHNNLSIIEGNFLNDYKLLKEGSPRPVAA